MVFVLQAVVVKGAFLGFVGLKNQPQHTFVDAEIAAQTVCCEIFVDQFPKIGRTGIAFAKDFREQSRHLNG